MPVHHPLLLPHGRAARDRQPALIRGQILIFQLYQRLETRFVRVAIFDQRVAGQFALPATVQTSTQFGRAADSPVRIGPAMPSLTLGSKPRIAARGLGEAAGPASEPNNTT